MLTASICHNDDDHKDPNHRRVKLTYHESDRCWCDDDDNALVYVTKDGDPIKALEQVYNFEGWDLQINQ